MSRCPITYQPLASDQAGRYSREGLKRLSPRLEQLAYLPFTADELCREAAARATKMSIQGVQPKLSAKLDIKAGRFAVVDHGGQFILKPQSPSYENLPENEDLTMKLAATLDIEVPVHGLIRGRDESWTYFIRRFDRPKRGLKLAVEDFAQLSGRTRDTKYNSSMERVAQVIERFATFPQVEKLQLFVRCLFVFLTGGEDMHLKNFSLITRPPRVQLAPAYDLLNSSIALKNPQEELALPLHGKKRGLTRNDLVVYFGKERLGLSEAAVDLELARLAQASELWPELITASFLPLDIQGRYLVLLEDRRRRLGF